MRKPFVQALGPALENLAGPVKDPFQMGEGART